MLPHLLAAVENWKIQTLPLARIKKIMKSEEFVLQELEKEKQQKAAEEGQDNGEKAGVKFMISGEAPVLMSKACELLIRDLSFRAWRHTERNRRRTLQRQDLHAAVGESEVYDFLIDIVPRVTAPKTSAPTPTEANSTMGSTIPPGIPLGLPAAPPQPMGAPAQIANTTPALIDNSTMQQMHMQQQQQPQHYPGIPQFQEQQQMQQQQQQQFPPHLFAMPQMATADITQPGMQMNTTGATQHVQQNQQSQQWMTLPELNTTQPPL
jgi:nuclear transcription factor Y gamma